MNKRERIQRAQHYEQLRNDDYLNGAFKAVEEQLLAELIQSDFGERERRDYVYISLKLLTRLHETILAHIRDGKIAVKEIAHIESIDKEVA